ncbi:cytochrome P450 [Suillus hirtellus]|nr:cytochrome P450 [Suillus hirtellus]
MLTLANVTWLDIKLCLACAGVYFLMWVFNKKNPAPYPPGPSGWLLIGNILDMPHIKPWLIFATWGKKYGNISHIEVVGQHIVVLNSVKAAIDMLDKKSTLYSDRPIFSVGGELVGWKHSLTLLPDGDRFRHTAGAIILRISYGYEVTKNDDPFVDLTDRGLDLFSRSTAPGAFVADFMPFLVKAPEWFPGAGFKRLVFEWYKTVKEMVFTPYNFIKDQMAAGIALESFTSNLLEKCTLSIEDENVVKWSAVSLYGGGANMTVSAIYSFFLAITLFHDVQKKAQAEIDAVIGPDCLPSFADRGSLPYTDALAKELLKGISMTGIPHHVTEDDIHDSYFIPKGSLVIPNIWFMLNNPQTYASPLQFNTECFFICIHLAEASIWISVVMSLAVFNISKVVENGVEITPEVDPSSGTISHPKPFKCSIKPRSAKAIELIEQDTNY